MTRFMLIASAALMSLVPLNRVQAQFDLYVEDGAAPGGGFSWADPYGSMDEAELFVDVVGPQATYEIHIAQGTYEQIDAIEWGALVSMYGGYRGNDGGGNPNERDPDRFPTILTSATGSDVVRYVSGSGEAIVDGLTFANGDHGIRTISFEPDFAVRDCRFVGNIVGFAGEGNWARFLIEDSVFEDNLLGAGTSFNIADVRRCRFLNGSKGLVHFETGCLRIQDCVFEGHSSAGMQMGTAIADVRNCVFVNNAGYGMDLAITYHLEVLSCLFADNIGGGLYHRPESAASFISCTFAAAGPLAGPHVSGGGGTGLRNCIVWGGPPLTTVNTGAANSNVQGGYPGSGNTDVDPLFVDPCNGDYRLQPGSLMIDAGANHYLTDATSICADTKATLVDLDGNDRFRDDPGTPDTGVSTDRTPVVDLGAYEFQGTTTLACPADTDGDGVVNVVDMVNVILAWGTDDPDADIDGDGIVNVIDLTSVILAWGPCTRSTVPGVCCLLDESCEAFTEVECAEVGGGWQGVSTCCEQAECPPPVGACCLPDGSCAQYVETACTDLGGLWQGALTACMPCPGACCFNDASCREMTLEVCQAAGGQWMLGDCQSVTCIEQGACCFPNGSCLVLPFEVECINLAGVWQGLTSVCTPNPCSPTGACCLPDASCLENQTDADCTDAGGDWHGPGTNCRSTACP